MKQIVLSLLILVAVSCGERHIDTSKVEPASQQQLVLIKEVQIPGNHIQMRGYAVKSSSHRNAYYVSTKIYGPGIDEGVTCVWFISGDKSSPGLIHSADHFAHEFTPDIPFSRDTKAAASMRDKEARAVKAYAEKNL